MSTSLSPSSEMVKPISETVVASMFDRIAGRYDFLNRLLSMRQDVRWRKALVKMVPQASQGRYLDMATGTGDVLLAVAEQHPEYASYLGGDISEGMLAIASQKEQRLTNSRKNIRWETMSAESIKAEDSSQDCLSIAFGLRNVVHKEKALQEFSRVLKPGGTLLILEFFTPTKGVFSGVFQFYFHYILPTIGKLFSEKEAYTYLPKSVASFYSPDELRRVLAANKLLVQKEVSFLFGACRLVCATRRP